MNEEGKPKGVIKRKRVVKKKGITIQDTKIVEEGPKLEENPKPEDGTKPEKKPKPEEKPKPEKKPHRVLLPSYTLSSNFEVGIDEVGRGPMFGRVYAAAAVLPKDDSFDHSQMKDSKRFSSKNKIIEVAEYIKENAIAWAVCYEDEKIIDEMNILQASQSAMHKCIAEVLRQLKKNDFLDDAGDQKVVNNVQLLVDGNYFNNYIYFNNVENKLEQLDYVCIKGGDDKYSSIAAASILAKVSRDNYIADLCERYPDLIDKYSIDSNKGYGSKKHIDGIKEHGITIWHRRSFGICKEYV